MNGLIIALDVPEIRDAIEIIEATKEFAYAFKIHALSDRLGLGVIEILRRYGAERVWLDWKLYDTPDAVALRAHNAKNAGAEILSVHLSGGPEMVQAAMENGPSEIFGISLLTSLGPKTVGLVYGRPRHEVLKDLARIAVQTNIHGIVGAACDIRTFRGNSVRDTSFVVPGIRLPGDQINNHVYYATPAKAVKAGANFLVVGSPITGSPSPHETARKISEQTMRQPS